MITTPLPPPPSLDQLIATTRVSLFLDFDGTLVEIAAGPEAIQVPFDISDRLRALADRIDRRLAIVSGRGLDNLAKHLGDLSIACAGSHGAERINAIGVPLGSRPEPISDYIVIELRRLASQYNALFEAKRHGAALHYRSNPASSIAIEQAAIRIAEQSGLVAKRGKCVIELVRPGADKGSALDVFMKTPEFTGSTPVFIGDDVTDEDGFAAAQRYGGLAITVGERLSKIANFKLNTVKDVHAWLNL